MRVLVTGADGFVGRALVQRLAAQQACSPVAAVRRCPSSETDSIGIALITGAVDCVEIGNLAEAEFDPALFEGLDAVVHCAARVHVMDERGTDPLAAFRAVNVTGTLSLARAAARAGVRRFVFLSSVKVHGESTLCGHPFSADSPLRPMDPYGVSKMEAERALIGLAAETGLEVVIIRPPLIYGPGVKANFRRIMMSLDKRVPLPLGAVRNQRSLVALDNLTDLLVICLSHPNAAGQAFLVSDGEDMSTSELLCRLGVVLGKPARLIPVPVAMLRGVGALLGMGPAVGRLCGSLQVDIAKTKMLLGWSPPVSVDKALALMAAAVKEKR